MNMITVAVGTARMPKSGTGIAVGAESMIAVKEGSPSRTALAATTAARAQLQARLAVVAQEDVNRIFEETGFDPEFYVEVRRRLEAKKQEQ